jgi:hypothetical protein
MQTSDQINLAIAVIACFSTIMSLAVVVATFKILRANREAVAVMKEQIRAVSRPYIQVSPWVRIGSTMLMLTIRNVGASAATKLKLSLDKDFYSNGEPSENRNLRLFTAFVHPIESLPPKAELSFHLGPGHIIFTNTDRCPLRFTITAEYEFEGERVTETTTVDLQPFMSSAQPIDPVSEQLKKLTEHVSTIAKKLQ